MTDNSCGNCRFWKLPNGNPTNGVPAKGICRYYPPQLSADCKVAASPMTFPNEWCGKHEPSVESPVNYLKRRKAEQRAKAEAGEYVGGTE